MNPWLLVGASAFSCVLLLGAIVFVVVEERRQRRRAAEWDADMAARFGDNWREQ